MKKNFFPMALMAIAMGLNACSSDDPVVNADGGKAPFADGGYVKMAINMPSVSSSRAAYNDNFDGGLKNEYEVKNATLILFTGKKGEAEDAAKFHSIYKLPVGMVDGSKPQITSTTRIVSKVNNDVPSSQLYAYVVLNDNGLLNVANSTINVPSSSTVPTTSLVGMTFSTFRNTVVVGGADKFKNNGFLMDNAPLSSEKGGILTSATPSTTSEPQTLVNLTDKVCKSQAEADAKPATDVYVERALAKVTMTKVNDDDVNNKLTDSGVSSIIGDGATPSSQVAYSIEGWVLDVTNKKSFLGRSYDKSWNAYAAGSTNNYRFLGSDALGSLYRTYWGIDPNYDGYVEADAATNFTYLNAKPSDDTQQNIADPATYNTGFGENNPLYCMENTFDVANMQERQVTRAIVKVKFFNGNPFYTFNDDKSTLYDKVNMEKRVKQAILKNPAALTKLATDFSGVTIGEGNIELTFGARDKDGKVLLTSYTVHKVAGTVDDTTDKTYSASTGSTLNQDLHLGSIVEYKDGYAYYPIRIKHFGDDLTPWNSKTATVDHPYGDPVSPKDFLGRYGVLRNNWYHIEITSIKNVGSAVVPEIELGKDTSGDKPENYISVRINVLSWAKRTQNEEL